MATDISKVGNVVQVTEGEAQPVAYSGVGARYSFNAAGTVLSLLFGTAGEYDIEFDDLTIGGAEPADTDAAYTALSTVFPNPNGGSGGSADLAEVLANGGDADGGSISGVNQLDASVGGFESVSSDTVVVNDGGSIRMRDTATNTPYIITVENGVFVFNVD
jgi:hypothetical protein